MKEAWVRFTTDIDKDSIERLFRIIDKITYEKYEKINLLIHSLGGHIAGGLALHNKLKSCPIPIHTYNLGTVESAAVLLYCVGEIRYCYPIARFMIHEGFVSPDEIYKYDFQALNAGAKMLARSNKDMCKIISETTGQDYNQVVNNISNTTFFSPEQAKEYGLVHEIVEPIIPIGAEIFAVGWLLSEDFPEKNEKEKEI